MIKPYLFDLKIKDPEDNESYTIRIEAEAEDVFYCWDTDGVIIDFHTLPEESKEEIGRKLEEYYFMRDAIENWSR